MKKFVMGLIVGLVLSGSVFAATYVAEKADFKVLVNGNYFETDKPIVTIDGSTYMPLRAVGEVLGVKVNWNNEKQQVEVGNSVDTGNAIGINEKTTYSDWEYKVLSTDEHSSLGDYTAKGKYIIAIVEMKNLAKVERNPGSKYIVKDSEGRVYKLDGQSSLAYHHSFKTSGWYLDGIGPSLSSVVPLSFDVAKDAKNIMLYSEDEKSQPIILTK